MIEKAIDGQYDDYKSDSPTPCIDLVKDCANNGLQDLQVRAMNGEFDCGPKEAEAWAKSSEGLQVLKRFLEK